MLTHHHSRNNVSGDRPHHISDDHNPLHPHLHQSDNITADSRSRTHTLPRSMRYTSTDTHHTHGHQTLWDTLRTVQSHVQCPHDKYISSTGMVLSSLAVPPAPLPPIHCLCPQPAEGTACHCSYTSSPHLPAYTPPPTSHALHYAARDTEHSLY